MVFNFINKQLVVHIPNKNKGKFRFKKRYNKEKFGDSFATGNKKFDEKVYLEWQIGYDVYIKDLQNNKKKTVLHKNIFKFTGANGKEKYPYELAEFLYLLLQKDILKIDNLNQLKDEIKNYNEFLITAPEVKQKKATVINKLKFDSAVTELPTYYYLNKDSTYIEIIIQKQQYASGFQPMVYFCIPTICFSNGREMLGWTSKEKEIDFKYCIDTKNSNNILDLFKVLAMASQSHQHDVIKILHVLEQGLQQ